MKITVTQPQKRMTDFNPGGEGDRALKDPYYPERMGGPLKVVRLYTGVAITKDCGPHEMTYSRLGGFRKYLKDEGRSIEPSKEEVFYFKRDINRAAYYGDSEARGFLDNHPQLRLEPWQL